MDCAVTFPWADGAEYRFALPLAQLEELQEKCGAGPEAILARLLAGVPHARDLREIIRLGLIGGGAVTPGAAVSLVARYVDARPRAESYMPARAVLMAAISGVPDDPVGKDQAAMEAAAAGAPAENSPSPPSMPAAP